ncbi:MAG TPA: AEC family transporter [Xanthobacteraceae bacterium]|nr:AEC family transporter [Xanthobacteraceae bacterium]
MHAVVNAAIPIFALILIGFLSARFGGFDARATDNLNRFAVYLALPALMFIAMSKITPEQIRQLGFSGAFLGGIALTFALGFTLRRVRERGVANASIEGLDASYSNVGFMGIPLCLLALGPESVPVAIIATLLTACVLFLFAIILIEFELGKGVTLLHTIRKATLSLVRSPLLIAPSAGLFLGLSGLSMPAPAERLATLLGGAASPCALVCIGFFLAQERVVSDDFVSIGILALLKLIVQPTITAILALYVFKMPPLWSHAAVLLSALPIGSGPFTIAKLYGLEAGVTSGAILLSHLCSVVTVSILVAWLS